MTNLITWLRVQLDEDERIVRLNLGRSGLGDNGDFPDYRTYTDDDTGAAVDYLHNFRPPRMLAEMEAKRRILEWLDMAEDWMFDKSYGGQPDGDDVRKLLALPYADRDGYDESWRP